MENETQKSNLEKGKQDALSESYNPPHGLVDELVTWGTESTRGNVEENMEYNRGYYLQLGKLHGAKKHYSPPDKEEQKLVYDEGYFYVITG